jgi:hypothetical protein
MFREDIRNSNSNTDLNGLAREMGDVELETYEDWKDTEETYWGKKEKQRKMECYKRTKRNPQGN